MKQQQGEALEKLLRQKQKEFVWLLDFQELFQEVLEAPEFLGELQENPAKVPFEGEESPKKLSPEVMV